MTDPTMFSIPGPLKIRAALAGIRRVNERGGPRRLNLERVGRPRGAIFPSSEVAVEIETRDGGAVRLEPELPVPFFYAWGYRLARCLRVPVARSLDPEDVSFEVGVPAWAWPGRVTGSESGEDAV